MPPPNQHVNIGGRRPFSPTSPVFVPAASKGDNGPEAAPKRLQAPLKSADKSQEIQTPDYNSATISETTETTICSPQTQQTLQMPTPMARSPPTDRDLFHDVYCFIEQFMDPGGPEIAECFLNASEQPPITPESLAELDMPRIINNPKLRHDVNFDRELHFRPNLDGTKGKEKMRLADEYWKALEGELFVYGLVHGGSRGPLQGQDEAYLQGVLAHSQKRLPKIFHAIRDILKTLVPDYDQKTIIERLDVDLIMQEIQNGVCDLIDLGNWLAKVLKNHCAPMRDGLVDRMQMEIVRGASEERPGTLVNGIRQLMSILEAMKLDVANHQIRHMRPLLVEDTINFQRRYNAHRVSMNKIDVPRSRLWLEEELAHMTTDTAKPSHLEALTSALLGDLLFGVAAMPCPPTFYLDVDRLRALRIDLHSMIYHEICRDILKEMTGPRAPRSEMDKAVAALHVTVAAIVGISGRFASQLENIAVQIMRIVLMIEGRNPPFDSTLLDFVEQRLETDLQPGSMAFENHAQTLSDKLLPRLQASIEHNVKLSALFLQDRLVPLAPLPTQPLGFGAVYTPAQMPQPGDPLADIVRRFTHVAVLHWQVWADLAYKSAPDDEHGKVSGNNHQSPPSSASGSPMIPVAQAVYAPGRKWLPIGVTVTEVPSGLPTPSPSPAPEAQQQTRNTPEQDESSSEPSPTNPEQQQEA